MSKANAADQLVHLTVRIETNDGTSKGSGTGFFLTLCNDGSVNVPVVATNKHVIEGAKSGRFAFTQALQSSEDPSLWEPNVGKILEFDVNDFENRWVPHPDPKVDLTVFPIARLMEQAKANGTPIHYRAFRASDIASTEYYETLTAIEDVLMVGYPIGLSDSTNNYPIIRRGLTATPPGALFEGRNEFMIDCACFPGSSGSPVVLYNPMGHFNKGSNSFEIGRSRLKLIGVLWGGPQYTSLGKIEAVPVPTQFSEQVAATKIPTNLGFCVRASELLWFEQHFQKIVDSKPTQLDHVIGEAE